MVEAKKKEYLFIVNDGPYGNERPYNALRMAMNRPSAKEFMCAYFWWVMAFNVRWPTMHTEWLLQHRTNAQINFDAT